MVLLVGITRDFAMQLAKDLGYEIHEKRLTRYGVYSTDEAFFTEAFFTGTAYEVTLICKLQDLIIGDGKQGSVTKKSQKTYF